MVGYFTVLALHAALLLGVMYWYLRAYRKAVHRSRRELERLRARDRTEQLEKTLAFYKERHDILLEALASGQFLLGTFLAGDPELRALHALLEVKRAAEQAARSDSALPTE